MLVNTRNGTLLLAVLAVACVATSCLPDNAYESCRLPPDEKLRCQGDDKTINCMVQHPACPDNYCITWQGGDSFCTQQCTKSSDCPEDGCCVPFILGCTTVNGVEKCPTLCVQRTQIEDGGLPLFRPPHYRC